jgi:hypothetical protein
VDRVQLHHEFGLDRRRRWRNGATASSQVVFVSVGRLADGRWWTHRTRDADGAYVFGPGERGEQLALRTAQRMMDDGKSWLPTVAVYGPDGEPADGLPWVRRGGEWFLDNKAPEPHGGSSRDN